MKNRIVPAARPSRSVITVALALAFVTPAWAQDAATVSTDTASSTAESAPATTDAPAPTADAVTVVQAPVDDAASSESSEATSTGETPAEPTTATTDTTGDPATTEPQAQGATPTAAEDDFNALYGDADAEAGTPAAPSAYDPWERYNRTMHRFNNAVDRRVARPLAQAYVRAVPAPVRGGVSNFFSNLGQPVTAVNALLQGKPGLAAHSLGRFVLNSTLGIAGVFDPASAAKLQNRSEDFGQTLGVWGWRRSRYVELPLFGPRTLRDVVGMAGDAPLSPLRQVEADKIRVPLQGMQLVDIRTQLLSTDAMREGVADDYALVRDAWSQRRDYQIFGDRDADALPDYLREEPTVVPVDAMPIILQGGN